MSFGIRLRRADGEIIFDADDSSKVFLIVDYFDLAFATSITKDYSGYPGALTSTFMAMEVGAGGYHTISISGSTVTVTSRPGAGSGTGYIVVGYQ